MAISQQQLMQFIQQLQGGGGQVSGYGDATQPGYGQYGPINANYQFQAAARMPGMFQQNPFGGGQQYPAFNSSGNAYVGDGMYSQVYRTGPQKGGQSSQQNPFMQSQQNPFMNQQLVQAAMTPSNRGGFQTYGQVPGIPNAAYLVPQGSQQQSQQNPFMNAGYRTGGLDQPPGYSGGQQQGSTSNFYGGPAPTQNAPYGSAEWQRSSYTDPRALQQFYAANPSQQMGSFQPGQYLRDWEAKNGRTEWSPQQQSPQNPFMSATGFGSSGGQQQNPVPQGYQEDMWSMVKRQNPFMNAMGYGGNQGMGFMSQGGGGSMYGNLMDGRVRSGQNMPLELSTKSQAQAAYNVPGNVVQNPFGFSGTNSQQPVFGGYRGMAQQQNPFMMSPQQNFGYGGQQSGSLFR